MKAFSKRRLLIMMFITIAIAVTTSSFMWIYQWSGKIENMNLKDLYENPQNYLGERLAKFTIVKITPREDPYHRLVEKYYLVYIRDSYGYELSFVISENDYSKYGAYVGKAATFKLNGILSSELMHPPNKLITNILVSKQADHYAREYCRIYIELISD